MTFVGPGLPSKACRPSTARMRGRTTVMVARRRMKTGEMVKLMPKPPPPEGEDKPLKEILIYKLRVFMSTQYVWCYLLKRKMGSVGEVSTTHRQLAQELKQHGSQKDEHACFRLGEELAKMALDMGCKELYFYRATIKSLKTRAVYHGRIVNILEGVIAQKLRVALDVEDYRQRHEIPKRDWPEIQQNIANFAQNNPDYVRLVNLDVDPRTMVAPVSGSATLLPLDGDSDDNASRQGTSPLSRTPNAIAAAAAYRAAELTSSAVGTSSVETQNESTFTGSYDAQPGVPAVPINRADYMVEGREAAMPEVEYVEMEDGEGERQARVRTTRRTGRDALYW